MGPKSLYLATTLAFEALDGGVPLGHLRKILHGRQRMAKVANGIEKLRKISTA